MSTQRKDIYIPLITVIADAVAIEAAFLFSYWLRFYSPATSLIPITSSIPPLAAYLESSFVVIPVWLWLFQRRGMFHPRRAIFFSDEFFAVVRLVCRYDPYYGGSIFLSCVFLFPCGVFIPHAFCHHVSFVRTILDDEV
jgi:hypothetical protein